MAAGLSAADLTGSTMQLDLVKTIAQAIAFQKEPTALGWAFYQAAVQQLEKDKK
jgi:hypothetical protein